MANKAEVFDLFYGHQMVTRRGGGTSKSRMTRLNPSFDAIEAVRIRAQSSPEVAKYFESLRDRDSRIAPPPRPAP
jgi:hypothetical protein